MNRSVLPLRRTAAALAVLLLLTACNGKNAAQPPAEKTDKTFSKTVEAGDSRVPMLLPDFAKLVEQEGAAVVNIRAGRLPEAGKDDASDRNGLNQFSDNDPFYEFFKRLVPNTPQLQDPEEDNNNSSFGSGFIISPDGYILTNTHVVKGMNSIKITLNDKREYTAKLVGSDTQSDVALLKIDAQNLPAVKIGNPKTLKPGEWVAAIGAPFGFDNSVTAGIVSAKGRSLPDENYTPFIQTDVAINPGNSGGPLFDLNGKVVGINSQIYSRSGGFMGISFAIPIDMAMNVAEQLKTTGKVRRGRLGVIIQEVSYDLAKSFGLDKPTGALIAQVMPGGPGEQAGLKPGDIVRSINGEEIRASGELPVIVGSTLPGKDITLGIWRGGKETELHIKLGDAEDNDRAGTPRAGRSDEPAENQSFSLDKIGLTVLAQNSGTGTRLIVARAEGIAAAAGLKRGDVIVTARQVPVGDEASLRNALSATAPGENVPLLVERNGNAVFLALTLP